MHIRKECLSNLRENLYLIKFNNVKRTSSIFVGFSKDRGGSVFASECQRGSRFCLRSFGLSFLEDIKTFNPKGEKINVRIFPLFCY